MTFTLETVKVVDGSLRVKFKVADSPAIRFVLFVLNAMTGATVSTAKVIELFKSEPSAFKLPAKSLKTSLGTPITPFKVLFDVGMNVAV